MADQKTTEAQAIPVEPTIVESRDLKLEEMRQAKESVKKIALAIAAKVKAGEALSKSEIAFIDDLRAIKEKKEFKETEIRKETRAAMRELLEDKTDSDKSSELERIYEEIQASLNDLRKNVDKNVSGKLGGVVSEEFDYPIDFKETTMADEFLDMLRAMRKLHADGKNDPINLTANDWKLAGHDGEYLFDQAELDEVNDFYAHIIATEGFAKIERILANCKNGGDLVRYYLNSKDVEANSKKEVTGTRLVPTNVGGVSDIVLENEETTDTLDILLAGEHVWGAKQFRKVLLDNVDGDNNMQKVKNAYKNVTGESFPANFAKNHEAAVGKFQEALRLKTNILNQLAKTNLLVDNKNIDGTSGLAVILSGEFSGKVEELARELKSKLEDGKELPNIDQKDRVNMLRTAVKYGLPILVSVLSQGIAVVDYNAREIGNTADFAALEKEYGTNKGVLMILHDVFVGKQLSLRFGENHAIENYVKEVIEFLNTFDAVSALQFSDDAIARAPARYQKVLRTAAEEYTNIAASLGDEKAKLLLRESLFKTVNIQAATAANPEDWSFRLSPLFIGGAREGVRVETSLKPNSELSVKLGKEKKLSAKDFEKQGILFSTKTDSDGAKWYVYNIANGNFKYGTCPETSDTFEMENSLSGDQQIASKTPLSFSIIEQSSPDGKVEKTLNIQQRTLKMGASSENGSDTVISAPNLENDTEIIKSVVAAFEEFRSTDRYGKFSKVQYAIADALAGKNVDFSELKKYISNRKLAAKMEVLMNASCKLSDDKKAMMYSAMLAEMAGDHRIRKLSGKDMPNGKTLKSLRGDAWWHPAAFNRRLAEAGVTERGNLDNQREALSDEVEKLKSLKGATSYKGVLSFTNFSQIWTGSDGKTHKGFQGVPYTGTEIKLVGEPKTIDAPAMRANFVDRLPKGVLDTFIADIKAKKSVDLTAEDVKALLADSSKTIKGVQISAQFKLGFFEKCLNDVYFFDNISYCGGNGGDCIADISGAPTGSISTGDRGNTEESNIQEIAAGINPLGLAAKALQHKKPGETPTEVSTQPWQVVTPRNPATPPVIPGSTGGVRV